MTRGPVVAQNSEWEHFPISIPIVAPVGVEDKLQLSCSQAFPFPPPYLRLPPPPSPRQWGWYPQAVPFGSTTPYPEPHCEIIDIAIFIMGVYALGYNLYRQKGWGAGGITSWPVFHPISIRPWPYFPVLLCFVQIYCELMCCHAGFPLLSIFAFATSGAAFAVVCPIIRERCFYILKRSFYRLTDACLCLVLSCISVVRRRLALSIVLKCV